ncbi:MAG: DNA topoisomerase IV subunit A [Firmicutes bacterium]|nr:DNA topoisomerase IV subunit A [Bacillota bacterium]
MAKKQEEKTIIEKIYDYTLEDIMGDRFGRYSKSIIQDRALPDVRDGLKPVQRRILYTMWESKNTHDKPYRKCAKAVGDVMGKYHPHGDSSIYGAMIYMSQAWKMREVFIDIHGNNGSIDGDGPAAHRYTETRLTKLALVTLKDINRDAVEMTLNYADEDLEPTVLPAHFPNLLVNGSTGISAGYATNIPPHNLSEVIEATIHRIDNPNCRLDTILNIVKGPDFPTGGVVEGKEGLLQAYSTGRGKVVVKAKTEIVKEKGTHQIIIHEIPYDVLKEQLRKKIEDIKIDKKVEGIADVIDVSDKEHMAKIIIELKKDANAELILNYLLKNTDLQVNYNFNMVAIVNRRPKQLGILEILDAFIAHQKDVILRRTKFDLNKAKERLHIVEGFLKAVDIIDEIIKIIRASKNKQESIDNLVERFEFTVEQATAIVMMRLYSLSNTDVNLLLEEQDNLRKMIEFLTSIIEDEEVLKKQMKLSLKEIEKEFGNPRRTEIRDEVTEIKFDAKDMIPKENVIVVATNEGYVKRIPLKSYVSSSGEPTTLKPGDFIRGLYSTTTLDTLLMFTNLGHYLYVPVHEIIETKWKELGKHISNLIQISADERIISAMILDNPSDNVIMTTKQGTTKRTNLEELIVSRYTKPINAMKLKDGDELVSVVKDNGRAIFVTETGYYLNIDSDEIPLVGAKASGVKGINVKEDTVVTCMSPENYDEYITVFTNKNTSKRIKISELDQMTRAKKGSTLIKKVKSTNYKITNAISVNNRDVVSLKTDGEFKEIKTTELPIMDLSSTGSTICKTKIEETFKVAELVERKIELNQNATPKKEEVKREEEIELPALKEENQELTIDDFIDDFKL